MASIFFQQIWKNLPFECVAKASKLISAAVEAGQPELNYNTEVNKRQISEFHDLEPIKTTKFNFLTFLQESRAFVILTPETERLDAVRFCMLR